MLSGKSVCDLIRRVLMRSFLRDGHLKIIYNNYKNCNENVYCGICCRIGYATKSFIIDNDEYSNNPAFSFILKTYIDNHYEDVKVLEENSFLYFVLKINGDDIDNDVKRFVKQIFALDISEDTFIEIKSLAKERFESNYKDERIRAIYKSCEIVELSKQFDLPIYIRSLDNITYEEFLDSYNQLVSLGNSVMVISGNINSNSVIDISGIENLDFFRHKDIRLKYRIIDNYILEDAHVLMKARNNTDIDILSFRFDEKVGIMDRLMYFYIEMIKVKGEGLEIHFDECDCGLIVLQKKITSIRELYRNIVTEEEFELSRSLLANKIKETQEKSPYEFIRLLLWLRMLDIKMDDVIDRINNTDYSAYCDIAKGIKPIIHEAQIVMR